MKKSVRPIVIVLFSGAVAAQPPEATPHFAVADVHPGGRTQRQTVRTGPVRNGRYAIGNATMLDLIRTAWSFDSDRILGGPNWLEQDRFDVIARVPTESTPESQKLMLQALLKDRFRLVLHEDMKPVLYWALTTGKKPQLKEADGAGESGCKVQGGAGPDETFVQVHTCRNMTMAAFADALRLMPGVPVGTPIQDQTGLQGKWNFEVRWSLPINSPFATERISVADALEKQLGLKLEQVPVPTRVLTVDSVERKPSPNPPGVKEALADIPVPAEFEVADVKLGVIDPRTSRRRGMRIQPGGRFIAEGVMLSNLVLRAFDGVDSADIVGVPDWANSLQVDITAKVPEDYPAGQTIDREIIAPMLRSLLVDRFGLTWHNEQRTMPAYSLVALKPKLKRADPESRSWCKILPAGPNTASGDLVLRCQNATLGLFAEKLKTLSSDLNSVEDATGLESNWDLALTFNPLPASTLNAPARSNSGSGGATASEPTGVTTIFQALEKQLGLKLESKKRLLPVIVIDKLNQKPTEN